MVVVAGLVAPALEDYLGNEAAEVIPFPMAPAACNKVNDRFRRANRRLTTSHPSFRPAPKADLLSSTLHLDDRSQSPRCSAFEKGVQHLHQRRFVCPVDLDHCSQSVQRP